MKKIILAVLVLMLAAIIIMSAMTNARETEQETAPVALTATLPEATPTPEPTPEPPLSVYDTGEDYDTQREILAIIIYQEQGGDAASDEARMAVGQVFVNRVMDWRFPDTFEEVALQKRQWGTLYRTGLVWPDRASETIEAHAVARAYECAEHVLAGEKTIPECVIFASEYIQGTIYTYIDNMYFCY